MSDEIELLRAVDAMALPEELFTEEFLQLKPPELKLPPRVQQSVDVPTEAPKENEPVGDLLDLNHTHDST